MRNYVEKLHKEDKLVFLTTTTNVWPNY
jgi:hypothetical protein